MSWRLRRLIWWALLLLLLAGCEQVNQLRLPALFPTATLANTAVPVATATTAQPSPTLSVEDPQPTEPPASFTATMAPTEEVATLVPTETPTPEPTATPASASLEDDGTFYWALIGDSVRNLAEEREAGIEAKVFSLSWRQYESANGAWNSSYINRKHSEYHQIRDAGLEVILSLGYHDPPEWIHSAVANSRYVNQDGVAYHNGSVIDAGDANLVWNQELRLLVERFTAHVFETFGTDFAAVRVGGGRFGELTYPPAEFEGSGNAYWAFDENAQAISPVPGWRPGDPAPEDEAVRFLDWYLNSLVEFQNWQIEMVRVSYSGPLMILYPSWGLRPGDIELALATNLDGSSPPEMNGEIQRGYDFARQVGSLSDPNLILTTTWLDANVYPDQEHEDDPRFWSPIRYLAYLAEEQPLRPALFGENTGQGDYGAMIRSAEQMARYGLLGMAWYRESEIFQPEYASLEDFAAVIRLTEAG